MTNDLHELSALYALDALADEDRARFEAHLAECEQCRRELAGLSDTTAALAFAVEGPGPPSALRARILEAAHAEPTNVVPLRRRSISTSVAAVIAVAATAAAVGFGIWAATLHHSLAHERTAVRVLGDPSSRRVALSGANGQLVVAPTGDAVLAVRLPALPNGKTYEAWIADGSVRRAGQFSGGTFALAHRVAPGARVMVTVETSGGVDAPTSQPILIARA
jgi:anti-sigma factor RsiW